MNSHAKLWEFTTEKTFYFKKKGVDKGNKEWYNKKAVEKRELRRQCFRSLKIEQKRSTKHKSSKKTDK